MSLTSKRKSRREDSDARLPRYTVGVVAERIGVPIATLRSWNQRYGVGPTEHRPGRHRLYSEDDVSAVEQMHQLIDGGASPRSAARAALGTIAPPRADTGSLLTAAFDLDLAAASRQLERHLRYYGVVNTWDLLIRPVFSAIEVRQAQGQDCIDVEHALSWAVTRSLLQLPVKTSTTSASTILAGTEGETHTLALEALRAALSERGRASLMLGADVPASALIDAIGRSQAPATVVLWAQSADTADTATAKAVLAQGARLMLGGSGWESVRLPRKAVRLHGLAATVRLLA